MFNEKRLLIVAGPTGCGKSTFIEAALGSKPSPLTKTILKEAFKRSDYRIERLYIRRLQKQYANQNQFQKYTKHYNNFILDIDITGPKFKQNSLIFPSLFPIFNRVVSVQIYTPFEIWLNQVLERKINSSFKFSKDIRRILHDSFSLKSQERDRAEKIYYEHYEAWESYLRDYNIKNLIRINSIQDLPVE